MSDSSEIKRFFKEQQEKVNKFVNSDYMTWVVIIGVLIVLAMATALLKSGNSTSYVNNCANVQSTLSVVNSKLGAKLKTTSLDASAQQLAMSALKDVQTSVIAECNSVAMPSVNEPVNKQTLEKFRTNREYVDPYIIDYQC